ncbi:BON domain-containing protein [Comamonas composti]|uniref:BON domain-containing protein n=1 Tax=Comamonas composti TaxID=408558 RepID=UPI000413D448|nr:BON domain-containing protein [Comamonas composti]
MCLMMQRHCKIIAITALAFGLAACNKSPDEQTAGQRLDAGLEQSQKTMEEAGRKAEEALDNAQAKMEEGAGKLESSASEAMGKAEEALDDTAITTSIKAALLKESPADALKIEVRTEAGVVTLSGAVDSEALKIRVVEIAKEVKGVVSVSDNLEVKAG